MRGILAACMLCVSLSAVHAQAIQSIEITEYGIYTADTANSTAAPGTASGKIEQVANIKLVQSTTAVPARLGVEFGFRYKIIGQAAAAPAPQAGATLLSGLPGLLPGTPSPTTPPPPPSANLKYVTHIPAPGIRNPQTGNVTMINVFYQDHNIGEELYRLYRLTDRWEVVPGVWTLEIWDGERKLVSQAFLVKK